MRELMAAANNTFLRSAIERLYTVFRHYQPPTHPAYCRHCVKDEEDRVLRTKPLRELKVDELSRYSWKAISTWGTVEQFKYLLPRLFETVVLDKYRDNTEVLFKKPRLGGLNTWPKEEQDALNSYCDALWRYALGHHPLGDTLPSFPSIDDCLCSIAQIVDDLAPLLNAWESDMGSAATLHLVDFAVENSSYLREKRRLSNTFWDERRAQMQQVVDWFLTRNFSLVFDVATAATTSSELCDDLTRAIVRRSGRG
jgi:hypothetical protein